MLTQLAKMDVAQLQRISASLRAGRSLSSERALIDRNTDTGRLSDALNQLVQAYGADRVVELLELLVAQQQHLIAKQPDIDLVWSGPDLKDVNNRDTGTVIRSLFRSVKKEAIVCGYAVFAGREIFQDLASRMDEDPSIAATMLLDIRPETDISLDQEQRVQKFVADFQARHWPGKRMPEIYFDPRSFYTSTKERASLHAKFVVVDRTQCLVSSANFTPAAQDRNIEAGVLIRSEEFALRLATHVDQLIKTSFVRRAC